MKTLTWMSFTVLLLASCQDSGLTSEERFWKWFADHSEEHLDAFSPEKVDDQVSDQTVFLEISDQLSKVNPAFSPFIGGPRDQKEREFIVTVLGDASLFDEVDSFIDSAPEIDGWKFIALKPALTTNPGIVIRTGTIEIKLDDARFVPSRRSDGRVDVKQYLHPGIDANTPNAKGLARALTVDYLGERLAGEVLGEVQIGDLEEAPEEAVPFLELKKTLNPEG